MASETALYSVVLCERRDYSWQQGAISSPRKIASVVVIHSLPDHSSAIHLVDDTDHHGRIDTTIGACVDEKRLRQRIFVQVNTPY